MTNTTRITMNQLPRTRIPRRTLKIQFQFQLQLQLQFQL